MYVFKSQHAFLPCRAQALKTAAEIGLLTVNLTGAGAGWTAAGDTLLLARPHGMKHSSSTHPYIPSFWWSFPVTLLQPCVP